MPAMSTILPAAVPVVPQAEGAVVAAAPSDAPLGSGMPSMSFADAFAQLNVLPGFSTASAGAGALVGVEIAQAATTTTPTAGDTTGLGQWLGLVLPPDGTTLPTATASDAASAELAAVATETASALAATIEPTAAATPDMSASAIAAQMIAATVSPKTVSTNAAAMGESVGPQAPRWMEPGLAQATPGNTTALLDLARNGADATADDAGLMLPSFGREMSTTTTAATADSAAFELALAALPAADQSLANSVRHPAEQALNAVNAAALAAVDPNAATRPATTVMTTSVATPVQHPQWSGDVGERVLYMVKNDIQHAEIRLNPAQLGPIEVRVTMHNDQAHLTFAASHGATREALEAALPKLREMFADAGLTLSGANVSGDGVGDSQKREQPATAFGQDGQRQAASGGRNSSEADENANGTWRTVPLVGGSGLPAGLDVFA